MNNLGEFPVACKIHPPFAVWKRQTKRKAPVTIVVGIKSKEGICVVCDSRTTEPTGIVRDDAKKLEVVKFNDENNIVVAQAGNNTLSSRAVEIMIDKARSRPLNDYRAGAELAEEAIVELKSKIRLQFPGSGEELQKHFSDYEFELMVAYYHNDQAYIFTVDFVLGVSTHQKRDSVSIGCGWVLADFLISRISLNGFDDMPSAMWTGVYAVEAVKVFDGRCGGPTKSAIAMPHPQNSALTTAALSFDGWMENTAKQVREFAQEDRAQWKMKVDDALTKYIAQRRKEQEEELKKADYIVGEDENGNPVRVKPQGQ